MISRNLTLKANQSAFLLGPRLTGKSSLIKKTLKDVNYWSVDLLLLKNRNKYSLSPELFREDALYQIKTQKIKIIYIDEIQKIPALLDEVHSLIEEYKIIFFISGSSPRKLKRGEANLLGGRVPVNYLMPFTYQELGDQFNLEQALKYGLLPGIYLNETELKKQQLMAYAESYLKEEILAEGIVRKLDPFSRFLEVAALYAAQTLNYSNISRESAVALKTVQNYFQILEDTLIGFKLPAWDKSLKKTLATTAKFYFFDNGLVNTLMSRLDSELDSLELGHLFEQFMVNEIRAHLNYKHSQKKLFYWKTTSNSEVDLIICGPKKIEMALEFKYKKNITTKDFSGLKAFNEDHIDNGPIPCYLIYIGETKRSSKSDNLCQVYNYQNFIDEILINLK